MKQKSPVFEENYQYYLEQIRNLDFHSIAFKLGACMEGKDMVLPFFGKSYRISKDGITGPTGKKPDYAICIIFFKYLLMCPDEKPAIGDWQSYKDFPDAAPLISYFQKTVKTPIAQHFSGKLDRLWAACEHMEGSPPDIELSHDLAMRFEALPKIPVLLTFNDEDDEFPAQCSVLFQKQTQNYLDMEMTAGLGNLLAALLIGADKKYYRNE